MTTSIRLQICKPHGEDQHHNSIFAAGRPVMSRCGARNSMLAVCIAEFRPQPLLFARLFCRWQRSQTSPVAVPEILCSLFASQNFDRCHSLDSLDSAPGGGRLAPHFDTSPYPEHYTNSPVENQGAWSVPPLASNVSSI